MDECLEYYSINVQLRSLLLRASGFYFPCDLIVSCWRASIEYATEEVSVEQMIIRLCAYI